MFTELRRLRLGVSLHPVRRSLWLLFERRCVHPGLRQWQHWDDRQLGRSVRRVPGVRFIVRKQRHVRVPDWRMLVRIWLDRLVVLVLNRGVPDIERRSLWRQRRLRLRFVPVQRRVLGCRLLVHQVRQRDFGHVQRPGNMQLQWNVHVRYWLLWHCLLWSLHLRRVRCVQRRWNVLRWLRRGRVLG